MSATPDVARTSASPPIQASASQGRRPTGFGALLLRLHFYAGVLVAPFLIVAALTGLAYTITPQLDQIVYADQLTVDSVGTTARPLAEQIGAARAAHPDGTLATVTPGEGNTTTQVTFSMPDLGEKQHTVYVDPYTAQTRGTLITWYGTTPLKTWFDDLHRNLHLGAVGRYYSEFAASWLWILTLGGLALWWRRHQGNRTARRLLTPDLAAKKGVRRTRGWHASLGVWLSLGLLVLSATGLTWSRYAGGNFTAALDAFHGSTPEVSTTLTGTAAAPAGGHHGGGHATGTATVDPAAADTVLKVARDNGITGRVDIGVPQDTTSAWTVTQNDHLWPLHKDAVAVNPATAAVVDRSDFADWPLLAKLTRYGIDAHMGQLFGIVNQILLAALAIGLICVIVWGYRMWWQRRPTRADRRAPVGAPPVGRGAWQQLPTWGIAVGVPVVFAIAWVLPLFGVPVLGFLVVDLVVGAIRGRRDQPMEPPVSPAPAGS
jgi:uncharacterized iron-regulated membrane protein